MAKSVAKICALKELVFFQMFVVDMGSVLCYSFKNLTL